MKHLRIAIISLIVIIITTFIIFTIGKDPQEILLGFLEEWNTNSLLLVLTIFGLSILSTLSGLPVNYLNVALGFFLAYIPALIFSLGINLIAIGLAFFMVRRFFSSYFQEKYGKRKIIKSIDKRIEKYKFWTVAFSRGIYIIPTNIINFSFPLSKISAKTYFIGTLIGLIPECIINVTIGYLIKHQILLLEDPQSNMLRIIAIAILLSFAILIFLFVRFRKKRRARIKDIVPLLNDED